MKYPEWLAELSAKEERLRSGLGLFPRRDGWYKTTGGKTRYICKPMTLKEAAALLPKRLEEIKAGRPAVRGAKAMSLDTLAETYLGWMLERVRTGLPKRLSRRTYDDNVQVIDAFCEIVGGDRDAESLGPADFTRFLRERLEGRAASTRRREIIYLEAFARWAAPGLRKSGILSRPWNFGTDFAKPSDDEMRNEAADADKAYTVAQIKAAFAKVKGDPLLHAAAHLGLCCGMIPVDLAKLPDEYVDLDGAIIVYPRGKTGVGRICPLVPEAVAALKAFRDQRKKAAGAEADPLFFRTIRGNPLHRRYEGEDGETDRAREENQVTKRWSSVVGLPYTGLRSTFATLADDWPDQRAVDVVLGHRAGKASLHIRRKWYAKSFSPDRARRLVEAVWRLAFGLTAPSASPADGAAASGPGPAPQTPPGATPATPAAPPPSSDA